LYLGKRDNNFKDRNAMVEHHRSGNSPGGIVYKSLNVNRILVWRTLMRFIETGQILNRSGQGFPRTIRTKTLMKSLRAYLGRNPMRSLRNRAKEANYLGIQLGY